MKRIISILMSITLVFSVVGGLFTVASADGATMIDEIRISNVPDKLEPGDAFPAITASSGDGYTVAIEWAEYDYSEGYWTQTSDSNVEDGSFYRVNITLTSESGYSFFGDVNTKFYINGVETSTDFGNGIDLVGFQFYYPVGLTEIKEIAFEKTAPTVGKTVAEVGSPIKIAADANYTIERGSWQSYDPAANTNEYDLADTDVFSNNMVYYYDFKFAPKAGYYFSKDLSPDGLTSFSNDRAYVDANVTFGFGVVTKIDISGVKKPEPFASASVEGITVPAGAGYSVSAQWEAYDNASAGYVPFNGSFAAGDMYNLVLTVKADSGNKFYEDLLDYVLVDGTYCDIESLTEDTIVARIGYYCDVDYNVIYGVTVNGFVEPKAGDAIKAVTLTAPASANYTLSAEWLNEDKTPASGKFEEGKLYILAITATAKTGYGYVNNITFTMDNMDRPGTILSADKAVYEYHLTSLLPKITSVDITVKEPEIGKTAASSTVTVNSDLVTVDRVTWSDDNNAEFTGTFEDGKGYYLEVFMLPKDGYVFSEELEVTINGEEFYDLYVQADYADIYKYYSFKKQISKAELTVPTPAVGSDIDLDALKIPDGANYTVKQKGWRNDTDAVNATGKFEDKHLYRLEIELVPNDGYEFAEDVELYVNGKPETRKYFSNDRDWLFYAKDFSFLEAISKVEFPALPDLKVGDDLANITFTTPDGVNYVIMAEWEGIDKEGNIYSADDDLAENDKAYALTVYAIVEDGYEINENTEFYIGGKKAADGEVDYDYDYGRLYKIYNFGLKEIKRVELTVQSPIIGEKLEKESVTIPEDSHYIIYGMDWYEHSSEEREINRIFNGRFREGKYYTVNSWFAPEDGYIFADDLVVVINGKELKVDNRDIAARATWLDVYSTMAAYTPADDQPDQPGRPDTGDRSNIAPFVAMAILSGAVLLVINSKRLFSR